MPLVFLLTSIVAEWRRPLAFPRKRPVIYELAPSDSWPSCLAPPKFGARLLFVGPLILIGGIGPFSDIVKACIAGGTLRRVDPDVAAQVIVSLAAGLILQKVFDPKGEDWGQVVHQGIQMFLDGLERKQV